MNTRIKKLCLAGILVSIGVILAPFSIPVGIVKCYPIQHFINVLAAVLLGRYYGVGMAFVTSALRFMLGLGTLMAFPGSMLGALCAGLVFAACKKIPAAVVGEVVGTGILGALAAYPLAVFVLGKQAAWFAFIIPFGISTLGGAVVAGLFLAIFKKAGILQTFGAAQSLK